MEALTHQADSTWCMESIFISMEEVDGTFRGSTWKLLWNSWNLPWKCMEAFMEVVESSMEASPNYFMVASTTSYSSDTASMEIAVASIESVRGNADPLP